MAPIVRGTKGVSVCTENDLMSGSHCENKRTHAINKRIITSVSLSLSRPVDRSDMSSSNGFF